METLKNAYDSRTKEITKFVNLMTFLEKKEMYTVDGEIGFQEFFYGGAERIDFTYQEMMNIFKSNVSLMLYNIIEFTVSGLIECIYDEIRMQRLSYVDVNESIRKNWRKIVLKAARDPNANFNTFLNKNEEIINSILSNHPLELHVRDALPTGNLDGQSIKKTFEAHGIQIQTNSQNYRPDILESIKENRNNLAHGAVSFMDAVRNDSINDIRTNANFIVSFLKELIETVEDYIRNERYKIG